MNISTILDRIEAGQIALPEFQRGYVWNRDQVRALMQSLYRKHPVGSLLTNGASLQGELRDAHLTRISVRMELMEEGEQEIEHGAHGG